MNVIDLRDELYKRQIEIIEITKDCVYYAEEMKVKGVDTVYLYCYDFAGEKEHIMSYFAFDDAAYLQHYYACKDSIIVLFENDGNKIWIVKVDKNTNNEVFRKTIMLVGRFSECVPIDDNNIIIYTKADDENRELFNRCLEETNCDSLANLYDLEMNFRYFIKDFNAAMLIKNNMHKFVDSKNSEHMILCEPFSEDEKEKEALSVEIGSMTNDIRDNIWEISKRKFLQEVKKGSEKLKLRRIASAGSEGSVRFECIGNGKLVFRAKVFASGKEQFFEMSTESGKVKPVCSVRRDSKYFTDKSCGKIYKITSEGDDTLLLGKVDSRADITYPTGIGRILGCIDDRFVIADNGDGSVIFDGKLGVADTYQARARVKDDVLVFY